MGWSAALAFVLHCLAHLSLGEVVPLNVPFQVAKPTPDHKSLMPVPEGMSKLAQQEGSIALVSVVGPYHSGKSFLLNAMAHNMQTFSIGRRTSPETMGIWVCRTNMTAADGSDVWLMDSEGFYGPGVDEGYDAKVFTVASLVGAHVIYNTMRVIDQQAVSLLEMLVRRAQLFRTRSSAVATAAVPDFLRIESFPPLTWVLEDFVQELPSAFRQEGPTGWLKTYMEGSAVHSTEPEGGRQTDAHKVDFLSSVFRDVRVHTLFLPASSKEHLQDLSRLTWSELTPEFRGDLSNLRAHVLTGLEARQFKGQKMSGPTLVNALRFILAGLQNGMFHELPSLWHSWALQVAEVSLQDAEKWFSSMVQQIDRKNEPLVPIALFNGRLASARDRVTEFYRAMLRDFSISPRVGDLRQRMDMHLSGAVTSYHDRIRRWVADFATRMSEQYTVVLATQELPCDPVALEKMGAATRKALISNFTAELKAFAMPSRSGAASQVIMPVFSEDPPAQLSAALTAKLVARSLENERVVQQLFKQAVDAADTSVSRTLNASSDRLLSKAQLSEIHKAMEQQSTQVFRHHLAAFSWAESSAHFKPNRALVDEQFRGRIAKFAAANEQRLDAQFREILSRVGATFRLNLKSIPMPSPEASVASEHARFADAAKAQLTNFVGNLSDTTAFADASKRFDALLKEWLDHLNEKNVELWKVHSDEATRCAVASNREAGLTCGWICLFNVIPWVHRSTSRRHLSKCFATTRSSMDASLQEHVFANWYKKDLGHEAERVSMRFWMITWSSVVVLAGTLGTWWMQRQPSVTTAPRYYNYASAPYASHNRVSWQQAPMYWQQAAQPGVGYYAPQHSSPCYQQQGHMQAPYGAVPSGGVSSRGSGQWLKGLFGGA